MAFDSQNDSEPVTALFDEDGEQLFTSMGILSVSVSPSNLYPQHTLENGVVITDDMIRAQDKISVKVILNPEDYKDVYKEIKKASNESKNFTIQTRVDTFDNMYIESMPHEESSRINNTIAMVVNFIEQQYVDIETSALTSTNVKNVADADTANSGTKVAQEDSKGLLLRGYEALF